ncbi:hypothetical protein KCU95_g16596, partial [Aureobasidium melanogenum]
MKLALITTVCLAIIGVTAQQQVLAKQARNIVFVLADDQNLHLSSLDYMPLVRKHLVSKGTYYNGFVDDNGLIYVLGRKKDILKRLGIPIPPILLENVLSQFGGVQASIFGLPDPKLGEEAVAVVSDMTGTTRERLQDLAVEHLGPDYPISKVFTLQELGMQNFPVNVTGKVMKIELRKAVEDLLSRESLQK